MFSCIHWVVLFQNHLYMLQSFKYISTTTTSLTSVDQLLLYHYENKTIYHKDWYSFADLKILSCLSCQRCSTEYYHSQWIKALVEYRVLNQRVVSYLSPADVKKNLENWVILSFSHNCILIESIITTFKTSHKKRKKNTGEFLLIFQ